MAQRRINQIKKDQLAYDLRAEFRSMLRQFDELDRPISQFSLDTNMEGAAQPRYRVIFDNLPQRGISGIRLRSPSVSLPDERIMDLLHNLAKSIWHLKDRLHQWVRTNNLRQDVEAYARDCPDLLIAADLANWKKHGRTENFSGQQPKIESVSFDTSQSGEIELLYNGATKDKELWVTNPNPLRFSVPVFIGKSGAKLGDAIELLTRAWAHWKPFIQKSGLLNDTQNREVSELISRLF